MEPDNPANNINQGGIFVRNILLWNDHWKFEKPGEPVKDVAIPHTWNAVDGTDGGNDYYRGTCLYTKEFTKPPLSAGEQLWIEFRGAAMTAEVSLNGQNLVRHEGGYSTFRANLTGELRENNLLCVSVDNSANDRVYPQKADFTFYGGIYRDVYLITVPADHFALDNHGAPGLKITPVVSEDLKSAHVTAEAFAEGAPETVTFTVAGQTVSAKVENGQAQVEFTIDNVRLWNGLEDPHQYTATAALDSGDEISVRFGCRSFRIDPEQGFFLNGRRYPLCGASRHQDRAELGSALTRKEHEEDIAIALEMGVNTLRLAHYQHDQYFYDLCDEKGLIVWAEIPYISQHMPTARENTLSQMTELVTQNYNHPSIFCWCLSNEITAVGGVSADMVENHKLLNDLCHCLDRTRPTTMAHAFMLDMDDPFVKLTDIRSYNLYYGWYLGSLQDNDTWFDDFHRKYPDTVIGLSEYGADANPAYQSAHPEQGDWSESYQAVYHEHLLEMWSKRPYIWAMHVWNLFDFGADGRNEGGKPGQNQKGLVTFDRKLKKDAFYLYKAYLSKEPFVHLCGSRYVDRTEAETEIKVYSNCDDITLFLDGKEIGKQAGSRIFRFTIPISGEHTIRAVCGGLSDAMTIRKVKAPNPAYLAAGGEVVNWFDKPEELIRPGYYSILDTMEDIRKNPQAAEILDRTIAHARKSYGDVAKAATMPESVRKMQDRMPFQKLLKQAGKAVPPAMVMEVNQQLNEIPKTKA